MYFEEQLSEEEEERIIDEVAGYIHEKGLETVAILFLESSKPLALLGSRMGRVFASPFFPVLGEDVDVFGQKMLSLLEKRYNIEKLIQRIEGLKEKED